MNVSQHYGKIGTALSVAAVLSVVGLTVGAAEAQNQKEPRLVAKTNSLVPAPAALAKAPVSPVVQEAVVQEQVVQTVQQTVVTPQNRSVVRLAARYGALSGDIFGRIRACESGGNYSAVSGSGKYRGAYQFDYRTWQSVGGSGDPAQASAAEQDQRAQALYSRRGASPWPVCGRR